MEDLTAGKDIDTVLSDVAGGVIAVVGGVKQIKKRAFSCAGNVPTSIFKSLDEGLDFADNPLEHMEIIS